MQRSARCMLGTSWPGSEVERRAVYSSGFDHGVDVSRAPECQPTANCARDLEVTSQRPWSKYPFNYSIACSDSCK